MATEADAAAFGPLLEAVEPLATPFAAAGFSLHLVGGSVRDALLFGRHDGDLDLTTDARPEDTLELVRTLTSTVWTQGQRFGTIGADIDGRPYEITTHRTERYEPTSRKPEVEFADALDEDLARRDFTINAMAVAVPSGELVDPYGGRRDLDAKVLRTPLAPEVSFVDDPLRMLRAGRFIARFGLTPVEELSVAAADHAARLDIVSVERVFDELTKLLRVERPSVGLAFLADCGLLARVLPEADAAAAGPVVDACDADAAVRLAALFAGAAVAEVEDRLRRLKASNDMLVRVSGLVEAIDALPDLPDPPATRRWVARGPHWRDALGLATILEPDQAGLLSASIDHLALTEDLDDQSLPVDGADVMTELGVASGPAVGEALRRLREHRFDHGPLTRDEALTFLRTSD